MALGLGAFYPSSAQAELVQVSVDGTNPGTPLRPVWPFFGFDEINFATSSEGKALLSALAKANSTPVHVRNHFLFNTGDGTPGLKWGSTNVYSEDSANNAVYSWPLSDGIMDAITESGAFPFVELGFMPQALSTRPDPYRNSSPMTLDGGFTYPPTDYGKWAELVRTWAQHADERYPNVSTSWLWELWNEPDIPYWRGTFEEYTQLFDYTESALHDALPNALLGGPAVASPASAFFRKFLVHCAEGTHSVTGKVGTRLDLVTFHAKGGVGLNDDYVQMNLGNQLRLHRTGFETVANIAAFKNTPIYITEADPDGCAACPLSSTATAAYRNSPAYGAYELAVMKHSLELASRVGVQLGGLLTWAFTFPDTPYFAGYRALTTNGIQLPVFGAFQLLGSLSGARLPLTSTGAHTLDELLTNSVREQPEIDGLAARTGDVIRVLVWNYHDDLLPVPATTVHLNVSWPALADSRLRVSHLRVDESHGDAYTVWREQGMPDQPSAAQVRALQQAMAPGLLSDETVAVSASGSVTLDFELPRFGVSLVTLRPSNATDGFGVSDVSGGAVSPSGSPEGCACRVPGSAGTARPWALLASSVPVLLAIGGRRRGKGRSKRKVAPLV